MLLSLALEPNTLTSAYCVDVFAKFFGGLSSYEPRRSDDIMCRATATLLVDGFLPLDCVSRVFALNRKKQSARIIGCWRLWGSIRLL